MARLRPREPRPAEQAAVELLAGVRARLYRSRDRYPTVSREYGEPYTRQLDRLDAGEPLTWPGWRLRGLTPLAEGRMGEWFEVAADGRVEPVDSPTGARPRPAPAGTRRRAPKLHA